MSNIKITPLGTISPYCKNNMNCPGFFIEYNDKKILLDCGNGINRFLSFPNDLNNLNIFITHYHLDHYSDIGSIQYASFVYNKLGFLNKKINIFLPINDYLDRKKYILNNKESYSNYFDISDYVNYNVDDLNISFYNNNSHSIESYIIKLQNDDFKVVYTSDIGTTNFDSLVNYCTNSDLLICESSFLRKHNSSSKTHFTAYNAGLLAKLSNSKKLMLTHFWPEESKDSYLLEAKEVFDNTLVAQEGKKLILRR